MANYGPFAQIVSYATGGLAAIGSITFAWKRRAHWEPAEEDVPTGGQKVAAVLALVALVYVYTTITAGNVQRFVNATIFLGVSLLIALLVYIFLISTCTYVGKGSKKIIGGLWTTSFAKSELDSIRGETIQDLLGRNQFEKDRIWPRPAQATARILFMLAYIGMIFCGTVAVTLAAQIVLAKATQPASSHEPIPVAPLVGSTAIAGSVRLRWMFPSQAQVQALRYQVETETNGYPREIVETRQNVSVRLEPGQFRWRIKAFWENSEHFQSSSESKWQTVKVYGSTLERIKDTKRIRIGQSEGFERTNRVGANGRPENFWTVWLPQVFRLEFQVSATPEIVVAPWMDPSGRNTYLHLLDQDPSIDVLASGLTILTSREKDYGIRFSQPIGVYKAMLVSRDSITTGSPQIRLGAAAQTTNEQYARQLATIAPEVWRFDEPDASIRGPDVYTDLLKALETNSVDAVIIDQPYLLALERDASIGLKIEDLQDAVKERNPPNQLIEIPEERIGVVTRIEDESLRALLQKYAAQPFTKNLWDNFYPGPPK
jgi:hypothetical protein